MSSVASSDEDDDIRLLNAQDDATYVEADSSKEATKNRRQAAWKEFGKYFDSIKADSAALAALPGSPSTPEYYLDKANLPLDYPTCAAFMTYFIAGARGAVVDAPSTSYVYGTWSSFSRHVELERREPIDGQVRRDIFVLLDTLINEGVISDVLKERNFTDLHGIFALVRSTLAYDVSIRHSRTRLQTLFWMALHVQTGQRVGASLPGYEQPDSRAAQYGDFNLHICANKDPTKHNVIVVSYEAPNHKTDGTKYNSHTLVPQRFLGICPVFLFLTLAHLDEALPFSLEKMLDPSFLDGKDERQLSMAATALHDSPFKSSDGLGVWSTESISRLLRIISKHANFPQTVTCHSFRRLAALYMRAAKKSYEMIQRKLGHIDDSDVTETYIKLIPSCDVSAALFDLDDRSLELLDLHPQCLRPSLVKDLILSRDALERIFGNAEVEAAQEALENTRQAILKEHGTLNQEKLPETATKDLLKAWSHLYTRVGRLTKYEQDLLAWELQTVTAQKPAVPNLAEQSSVAQGDGLLPADGAIVGFDGLGMEHVLSTLEVHTDGAPPTMDTGIASEQPPSDQPTPAPAATRVDRAKAFVQTVAETEEAAISDLESLNTLELFRVLVLTADDNPDYVSAVLAWTDVPDLASSFACFRPGHTVLDNLCNSCSADLTALYPKPNKVGAAEERRHQILCFHRHLMDCHAARELDRVKEAFLSVHGPKIPAALVPFTFNKHTMAQLLKSTTRKGVKVPSYNTKDHFDILSLSSTFWKQLEVVGDHLRCESCDIIIISYELLCAHLLLRHDLWLLPAPLTAQTSKDGTWRKQVSAGQWDAQLAQLPTKFYFFPDATYIAEPAEYEARAEQYIRDMMARRANVTSWGLRPDIILRGEQTDRAASSVNPDVAFRWESGRFGKCVQQGICCLCFWDPSVSASETIRDWRDGQTDYKYHCRTHLAQVLLDVWDPLFGAVGTASSSRQTKMYHYLVNPNGMLACPDSVCRANDISHPTALDFVDHLVAYHYLQITGTTIFGNKQIPIEELSYEDLETLEQFVREGMERSKSKKKAVRDAKEVNTSGAVKKRKQASDNRRRLAQRRGEQQAAGWPVRDQKRKRSKATAGAGSSKKQTRKRSSKKRIESSDEEDSNMSGQHEESEAEESASSEE